MPKFYATGTKQFNEVVKGEKVTNTRSVLINLDNELTRIGAVNEAERIARTAKVKLDGVFVQKGTNEFGYTMTKNAKARKALRSGNKKRK